MGAPAPHLPTGTAVSLYPHGSTSPPQSPYRNNSFPISLWEHQPPISLWKHQPPSSQGSTSSQFPYGSTSPSISPGEHQACRRVPLRLSFPCSSSGNQVVDMMWKGLLPSEPSHQPLYLNLPTKRFWCPSAAGKHQTLLAMLQTRPHTILHIARDLWIFVFPPKSHGKVPVPTVEM